MASDSDPPAPTPSRIVVRLECRKCGKSEDQTVAGLFDFLRTAWPECCGEAMALRLQLRWPDNPPDNSPGMAAL